MERYLITISTKCKASFVLFIVFLFISGGLKIELGGIGVIEFSWVGIIILVYLYIKSNQIRTNLNEVYLKKILERSSS